MSRSNFGHIRKWNNGKYRVYWQEQGKKHSKVVSNRQEGLKLLAKLQLQHGSVDSSVTYDSYFENVIKPTFKHLAVRTAKDYEVVWKKLSPYIGKSKIANTTWRDVQFTIDEFSSPQMQKKVFVLWRKILNFAIRDDIIIKNPCDRHIKRKPIKPKPKRLYTKDELCNILEFVDNTKFSLPVLLDCCCGLRHEEFCALNRRDIEIDDEGCAIITIDKALTEVYSKKVLKDTKTTGSERIVILHSDFVPYLSKNIKYITNKRTLKEHTHPDELSRSWKRFCNKHDLIHVTFGNMRSVYATLSSEAGCIDSIVGKTMGHTGSTIKEKNYQLATIQALKINAGMFAKYINFEDKLRGENELSVN